MNRNVKIKKCLALASLLAAVLATTRAVTAEKLGPTANLPIAPGLFMPTWESLKQYECPEWFRDAKFGIWAHWNRPMPARARRLVRPSHVRGGE